MSSSHLFVVTGGAGFIGSHAVRLLLERGHRVVVLDNFSTGKLSNLADLEGHPRLRIREVNIVDGIWPGLTEVTNEWGRVERILHLAAQTTVLGSVTNPVDDIRINYAATAHVLEYARFTGVARVVFASSAATYGEVETLPVTEDMARWPVSPYGINKLGSEMLLRYYTRVHGIETVSLRFFNVYGPNQDPASTYSGVISKFVERALGGNELLIFGDGEQTRDFIYVGDVARALVDSALLDTANDQVMNIATGTEVTINQLARFVVDCCNSSGEIRHGPARSGEILRSVAEVERAREIMGFETTVALAEGLRHTVRWFESEQRTGS